MTDDGRRLVCTKCRCAVIVYELPRPFIDPALYVCGWCLDHKTATLLDNPLQEHRPYDPAIAEVPY